MGRTFYFKLIYVDATVKTPTKNKSTKNKNFIPGGALSVDIKLYPGVWGSSDVTGRLCSPVARVPRSIMGIHV